MCMRLMSAVYPVYLSSVHNGSRIVSNTAINVAHRLLMSGGVVAVPTDTVYGLAALAQLPEAIDRMYEIKSRDSIKPVAICVASVADIGKWSRVTVSEQLLNDLLPGPVTVLFERLPVVNSSLNPETNLLGTRIPDNEFIRELCTWCDSAIALTSANISSEQSCLAIDEFKHLWPQLDAVFDGGILNQDLDRLGSTLVDLSIVGCYKIIRKGCAFESVTRLLENKYSLKPILPHS